MLVFYLTCATGGEGGGRGGGGEEGGQRTWRDVGANDCEEEEEEARGVSS